MEHASTTDRGQARRPNAAGPHRRSAALLASVALIAVASSCSGRSNSVSTETVASGNTATSVTTASPSTTEATSTTTAAPPTTLAATTTTVAETTTVPAPTTTAPLVAAGWRQVDTFPTEVFPPYDEGNWTGKPSPALPAAGQPLPDGIYAAKYATPWTAATPGSMDVVIHRLDACTALPADVCTNFGDPYADNEMGVDESSSYNVTVPLDGSIAVGLTGYNCNPVDKLGSGTDMAALFTAFDSAYTSTITSQLNAGVDDQDIVKALTTTPAGGFAGEDPSCSSGLIFTAGDAPPLLLQIVVNVQYDDTSDTRVVSPLDVSSLIYLNSVQVTGGVPTFYFYAGFYS